MCKQCVRGGANTPRERVCRELTCEGTESNYMHGALILSPLAIMCAKACNGHPNGHVLRDGVGVCIFFLIACVLFYCLG